MLEDRYTTIKTTNKAKNKKVTKKPAERAATPEVPSNEIEDEDRDNHGARTFHFQTRCTG